MTDMNDQHIASAFDRDLEAIQAQIMKMGGLVEAAIMEAAISLETRDVERAEKVRQADKSIDALEERLADFSASGALSVEDPKYAAWLFLSMLKGIRVKTPFKFPLICPFLNFTQIIF